MVVVAVTSYDGWLACECLDRHVTCMPCCLSTSRLPGRARVSLEISRSFGGRRHDPEPELLPRKLASVTNSASTVRSQSKRPPPSGPPPTAEPLTSISTYDTSHPPPTTPNSVKYGTIADRSSHRPRQATPITPLPANKTNQPLGKSRHTYLPCDEDIR